MKILRSNHTTPFAWHICTSMSVTDQIYCNLSGRRNNQNIRFVTANMHLHTIETIFAAMKTAK